MEDYLRMLQQLVDHAPDVLFPSPAFAIAFRAAMAGLTLIQTDIVFTALDFVRNILTHDCLNPQPNPPPKFPVYAAAIRPVVEAEGLELVGCLLSGLTGDFPEESASSVVTIISVIQCGWAFDAWYCENGPGHPSIDTTVGSGCYCAGYKAAPAPIKPGQSAVIELVYNPRQVGTHLDEVRLASNDLHGEAKLLLKAEVVKDLTAPSLVKESSASVPFK